MSLDRGGTRDGLLHLKRQPCMNSAAFPKLRPKKSGTPHLKVKSIGRRVQISVGPQMLIGPYAHKSQCVMVGVRHRQNVASHGVLIQSEHEARACGNRGHCAQCLFGELFAKDVDEADSGTSLHVCSSLPKAYFQQRDTHVRLLQKDHIPEGECAVRPAKKRGRIAGCDRHFHCLV